MKQVHLYYGEEDFLIDEEIKKLRQKIIKPSFETMNFERLDGGAEDVISKIISFVGTPSMLGGERLLVVENAYFLKEKGKDEEMKELEEFLRGMPDDITVVFSSWGPVDKRMKMYKLIADLGEAREFKSFAEWEQEKLLSWIVDRVKGEGKTIGSHAARLLTEISGNNLRALYSEIQKLVTYIGEKQSIEEQDVKALASSFGIGVFSLIGALRNKNIKSALRSVSMLLGNREEPVMLLAFLASQYRMMLEVKSLTSQGREYHEIAGILRASPYFVRKCGEGAENFSLVELVQDMELLHNADLKLKKGSPGDLTFELLVTELCGVK